MSERNSIMETSGRAKNLGALPRSVGTKVALAAVLFCVTPLLGADVQSARRPNILLIMADDLGREWLSCYGSEEHKTPHLDHLAAGGMRFKNVYAMPLCTPTRHVLLTGRYPFRQHWCLMNAHISTGFWKPLPWVTAW